MYRYKNTKIQDILSAKDLFHLYFIQNTHVMGKHIKKHLNIGEPK